MHDIRRSVRAGYFQFIRDSQFIQFICACFHDRKIRFRSHDDANKRRIILCTRFKQEVGVSLTRYVQQEKVAEAKRLLRFTDQELGEIAALLGFSSQSHFQTVFKQITGETPMAYRRNSQV